MKKIKLAARRRFSYGRRNLRHGDVFSALKRDTPVLIAAGFAARHRDTAPAAPGEVAADEAQADEAQADEAQADEAQADEAQADEAQADEAQADQVPADQVPADQVPADQVPADEAQADQVPADEAQAAHGEAVDVGALIDEYIVLTGREPDGRWGVARLQNAVAALKG
jgi:hypothetical protein